jgi:hypothetical protein
MGANVNRRQFLSAAAAAGGVLAAAGAGLIFTRRGVRPTAAAHPLTSTTEVRAFFGDLWAGARLDRWTVVAVHDASAGGIPVEMATADGTRFQVDVLRRDDASPGVANTKTLSLYLCNRGDGRRASDEEQGLGALALAHALEAREAAGAAPPRLLTLRERNTRFPQGAFAIVG